jgi:hypothetical protein
MSDGLIDLIQIYPALGVLALILAFLIIMVIAVGYLHAIYKGRKVSFWPPVIHDDYGVNQSKAVQESKLSVELFYTSLQNSEYRFAWDTLSENMKKRVWGNQLDKFVIGFDNMLNLSQVVVFPLSTENDSTHRYGVFYRSVTKIHLIQEISGIAYVCLKSAGELYQKLEKLRDTLKKVGAVEDDINNLQIKNLVNESSPDEIRYKLHLSIGAMDSAFPTFKEVEKNEICEVFVVKRKDGTWKVDRIKNLTRSS